MCDLRVYNGELFVDGEKILLKKGKVDENLLYGVFDDEKIFAINGEFYKGKNWINTRFIGSITKDKFLELKNSTSSQDKV